MSHESYAFQEEKHFSNFSSSRKESREAFSGGSVSRAIHGGSQNLHAIRGGDAGAYHYISGGEDEDKFAFNFPGPNSMPLHASDGSSYEGHYKGKPSPVIREVDDDLNSVVSENVRRQQKHHGSHAGSQIAEENYVYTNKSSSRKDRGLDNSGSANTIISSSNSTTNNWTLSPVESQKRNVFAPQRSSTMINKGSSKLASVTTTTMSAETSSTRSSRSSKPVANSPSLTSGDHVVYERIPVTHESHHQRSQESEYSHQRHEPARSFNTSLDRSEMSLQEDTLSRKPYSGAPRHVSSVAVGESTSGAVAGHHFHAQKESSRAAPSLQSYVHSGSSVPPGEKGITGIVRLFLLW